MEDGAIFSQIKNYWIDFLYINRKKDIYILICKVHFIEVKQSDVSSLGKYVTRFYRGVKKSFTDHAVLFYFSCLKIYICFHAARILTWKKNEFVCWLKRQRISVLLLRVVLILIVQIWWAFLNSGMQSKQRGEKLTLFTAVQFQRATLHPLLKKFIRMR